MRRSRVTVLGSTGSVVPDASRACYRELFANPSHVRGTMGFMAAADLPGLLSTCARLPCSAAFLVGERDRWVPQAALRSVLARHLPGAAVQAWPGGHLLHEEQPARAAQWVLSHMHTTPYGDTGS